MPRSWFAVFALLSAIGFDAVAHAGPGLAENKTWAEARQNLAQGKPAEAREQFDQLLREYPKDPDLYLFSGISWLRLRDPNRSAELL